MPINKKKTSNKKTVRKKQGHHITREPEWIVPLNGWQHKVISIIEHLNPTEENYRNTLNFYHALAHQLNRLAYQLYEARKGNINP